MNQALTIATEKERKKWKEIIFSVTLQRVLFAIAWKNLTKLLNILYLNEMHGVVANV